MALPSRLTLPICWCYAKCTELPIFILGRLKATYSWITHWHSVVLRPYAETPLFVFNVQRWPTAPSIIYGTACVTTATDGKGAVTGVSVVPVGIPSTFLSHTPILREPVNKVYLHSLFFDEGGKGDQDRFSLLNNLLNEEGRFDQSMLKMF